MRHSPQNRSVATADALSKSPFLALAYKTAARRLIWKFAENRFRSFTREMSRRRYSLIFIAASFVFSSLLSSCLLGGGAVKVTILHTNDLHSQFRPQKGGHKQGGLARLKTKIDEIRSDSANSLLMDGGDFSEGGAYFAVDGGPSVLQLMDQVGYDFGIIGNHDFLNGPDILLDALKNANPKMTLVTANIDAEKYARAAELNERILPYAIKEIDGIKIAVIGLTTYEAIYDSYFSPVTIVDPLTKLAELTLKLKGQVDSIIVISHNSLLANKIIATANPFIDLIIGAHDHKLLTEPIAVSRGEGASPAWIVEVGHWGEYLGQVDLEISKERSILPGRQVKPIKYTVHTVDSSIEPDPKIDATLDELDSQLEEIFGKDFFVPIAESDFDLSRDGLENLEGNLMTDVYRKATGADVALDQMNFIYGNIYAGPITSADLFLSNPGIHDPKSHRSWTLKTLPVSGASLNTVLSLLFANDELLRIAGGIAVSGAQVVYKRSTTPGATISLHQILIDGKPIDMNRDYLLAMSGGGLRTLQFLNSLKPGVISLSKLKETGIETWRAVREEVIARKVLNRDTLRIDNRFRSNEADIGVVEYDIGLTSDHRISITISNFGLKDSIAEKRVLSVFANGKPLSGPVELKDMAAGASQTLTFATDALTGRPDVLIEARLNDSPATDLNPGNHSAHRRLSF